MKFYGYVDQKEDNEYVVFVKGDLKELKDSSEIAGYEVVLQCGADSLSGDRLGCSKFLFFLLTNSFLLILQKAIHCAC